MRLALALVLALLAAVAVALMYRGNAIDARADLRAIEADLEDAKAEVRSIQAQLQTSEGARAEERARAERMYEVAAVAEQERIHAEETGARVTADLRADNLRLRQHWRSCESARLPGVDPAPGEPDAVPDDRAESAGRIVRAAAECDAQVRGLQAVVREYLAGEGSHDR